MYMLLAMNRYIYNDVSMFHVIYIKSHIIAESHLWSKNRPIKNLKKAEQKSPRMAVGKKSRPKFPTRRPEYRQFFPRPKSQKQSHMRASMKNIVPSTIVIWPLTADRLTVWPTARDALTICGKPKSKETKKCKTVWPTANNYLYYVPNSPTAPADAENWDCRKTSSSERTL